MSENEKNVVVAETTPEEKDKMKELDGIATPLEPKEKIKTNNNAAALEDPSKDEEGMASSSTNELAGPTPKVIDNKEEGEEKEVYKHGFEAGDHIVRWEMLPIAYPIQIHGIVLETLEGGGIVIADFGLSSCEKDADATSDDDDKVEGKEMEKDENEDEKDESAKAEIEENNSDEVTTEESDETAENVSQTDETSATKKEEEEDQKETTKKEAEATILAAWEKFRPKEKNKKRLNVITLTDEKDLRKWGKVNYGGKLFGFGAGASTNDKNDASETKKEGQTESAVVEGGKKLLKQTAKWFDSFHDPKGSGEGEITSSGYESSSSSINTPSRRSSSPSPSLQNDSTQNEGQQQALEEKIAPSVDTSPQLSIEESFSSSQADDASQQQQTTSSDTAATADGATTAQNESNSNKNNEIELIEDDNRQKTEKSLNQNSTISRPTVPLNNYGATAVGASASFRNKRPQPPALVRTLSSSFSSWIGGAVEKGVKAAEKISVKQSTTDATNTADKTAENNTPPASSTNNTTNNSPPRKTLPKSDPAKLVLARTKFLLQHGESILPPYHVFDSNSECIAVWCKTGTWSTLQASIFLHTSAIGNAKSSIALGLTVAAVQPWLVPAMAGMGLAAVGMPWMLLWSAKGKWEETTKRLTDAFWKQADNEVFVECIEAWSGLAW